MAACGQEPKLRRRELESLAQVPKADTWQSNSFYFAVSKTQAVKPVSRLVAPALLGPA